MNLPVFFNRKIYCYISNATARTFIDEVNSIVALTGYYWATIKDPTQIDMLGLDYEGLVYKNACDSSFFKDNGFEWRTREDFIKELKFFCRERL